MGSDVNLPSGGGHATVASTVLRIVLALDEKWKTIQESAVLYSLELVGLR